MNLFADAVRRRVPEIAAKILPTGFSMRPPHDGETTAYEGSSCVVFVVVRGPNPGVSGARAKVVIHDGEMTLNDSDERRDAMIRGRIETALMSIDDVSEPAAK